MAATMPPAEDPAQAGRPAGADTAAGSSTIESSFDSIQLEREVGNAAPLSRWMGWRLRLLVGSALLGCIGLFMFAHWLGGHAGIDAAWRVSADGQLTLAASNDPTLAARIGQPVTALSSGATTVDVDALALRRSARWIASDATRERHRVMHEGVSAAVASGTVGLVFTDGTTVQLDTATRGMGSLGGAFWLLAALALALYLVAMVVVLARPCGRTLLYAVIALCQAANLLFIAVESSLALSLPWPFAQFDMPVRMALDLACAAAVINVACVHPRRLAGSGWITLAAWAWAAALPLAFAQAALPHVWWWVQCSVAAMGVLAIALLNWSYHLEPHPFAMVLRRFASVSVGLWLALTLLLAAAPRLPQLAHHAASLGPMIWSVFLAGLLLLLPFLSKSQQIMREFALLAIVSTVATSLDLLFVALFSLGQVASLTLALFLSLGAYAGARQWILNRMMGTRIMTAERMFERLYRVAREIETRPERTPALVSQLLRELFDPMDVGTVVKRSHRIRVSGDGSTMVLPVPQLGSHTEPATARAGSIVLRFAHRGRRLFTSDDARLAERILEQLARAVAFDKAVEQGRERGTRASGAGPARRHRRPAADADVQGLVPRDGGVRSPHAQGSQDTDAWPGGAEPSAIACGRRMEGRPAAAADGGAHRTRLELRVRRRHHAQRDAMVCPHSGAA